MDWKIIIRELMDWGFTQEEIGAHTGISQSTVSDLKRGRLKSIRYEAGTKLMKLHKRFQRKQAA